MKKLLFIVGFGLIFASCQKVIDVDLNESNPQVVIEGVYTAEDSTVRVRVSLTSSYFDASTSPTIDNATITIIDYLGNSTPVNLVGNGVYELANYAPQFNTTYTLNVAYNGILYEAECDLQSPTALNDITYQYTPGFFGLPGGYLVYLNFNDPPNVINNYLIVLSQNGTELNDLTEYYLQDDLFTDGNTIERPLFGNEFFNLGDTIGMEMRTVDKQIYDYFDEVISIAGGGGGAAPANPTTNWNNKALGYFSAYGNSRKTIVIQ